MTLVADRAQVLGCAIDRVDMSEAARRCDRFIRERAGAQHMAINAAKIVAARHDPELRALIAHCELITADGQSVVWASRLLGDPLPARVAGIDLMLELLALAEARGYRVYLLGARPETLRMALQRLRERHPRLVVAGYRDGYFSDEEEPFVAAEIRAARADLLFVGMPTPRKEYFIGRWGPELGVAFSMGVGGAIDVVAGVTRRAPRLLQRMGLEWAFRLAQEPRRLMRRYMVTNSEFVALTLHDVREIRGRRALDRVEQLVGAVQHHVRVGELGRTVRAGRHRDAAHPVSASAGDVARGVADDDGLRPRVVAGPAAGDGRELGAVLVVGSEAALPGLEEAAKAGASDLQARDRLEVAGEQRQPRAVARSERREHVADAGGDVLAEVVRTQPGVGGHAGDAEVLAPGVEALGGNAGLQADRPGDLVVGPAGGVELDRAEVGDAVDLPQPLVDGGGVGGGGLEQEGPVDVEEQQHAAPRCQKT